MQWTRGLDSKNKGARHAIIQRRAATLPEDIFSEGLALPTLWVAAFLIGVAPSTHTTKREALASRFAREGMRSWPRSLFFCWDLGEPGTPKLD